MRFICGTFAAPWSWRRIAKFLGVEPEVHAELLDGERGGCSRLCASRDAIISDAAQITRASSMRFGWLRGSRRACTGSLYPNNDMGAQIAAC
ncbi:MAG: hypothetical protein R3B46_14330 [Phycisphaerales bacterium]